MEEVTVEKPVGILDVTSQFKLKSDSRRRTIIIPQAPPEPEEIETKEKKRHLFKRKSVPPPPPPPPKKQLTTEYSNAAEDDMKMDEFYDKVEKIMKELKRIEDCMIEVSKANKQYLVAKDDDEAFKCNEYVESNVNTVEGIARDINMSLSSLENETEEMMAESCPDPNKDSCKLGYARIRTIHSAHLRSKLSKLMSESRIEQEEAKARKQDQLARQLRILDPNLSQEEATNTVSRTSDLTSAQLFSLAATKESAAKELERLQLRHVSMMNVEKSVMKLARLFNDMQNLVREQGEWIEDTKKCLAGANTFLEKAVEDTHEGVQRQKTIRKLKCAIF
jgi:t-SNARE complex subunit (syntaxin)